MENPHPTRRKIRGVPAGVPGKKYILRIPYRGAAYKRRVWRALDRADLGEIAVMEKAGTTLGQLLCPSKIDGGDSCGLQNCWYCADRLDDPKKRRECMSRMCIYTAQCMHCADAGITAKYVGQTQQRVKARAGQHLRCCLDPNFMNNINPAEILAAIQGGNGKHNLPSAIGMHHHQQHQGLDPRWVWKVVDTAMTVNELDAKEAAWQTYETGFTVNHNLVMGPH
jgi:hypothetical protein